MQYDAVNLSQGFWTLRAAERAARPSGAGGLRGLPPVFHYLVRRTSARRWPPSTYFMGRRIDPNTEIVTTCGSTEAMMAAMMTVTNPGDKVVIFPRFTRELRRGHHSVRCRAHLRAACAAGFHFDANVLEDAFRQHPKAIILCNPSNPCGKVFTRESWKPSPSGREVTPTLSPTGV